MNESRPAVQGGAERAAATPPYGPGHGKGLTLREYRHALKAGAWLIVAMALASALLSGIASNFVENRFSATTVLSTAIDAMSREYAESPNPLAALELKGLGDSDMLESLSRQSEALAVLKSESLTEAFIQEEGLLPILYSDQWDPGRKEWKNQAGKHVPTLWEASRFFGRTVRNISTDYVSGLTKLTITWKNPQLAANWANSLVAMANARMRQDAVAQSERKIALLSAEAAKSDLIAVKKYIANSIVREYRKVELARGDTEFGLKVVDPAYAAGAVYYPNFALWVVMGGFLGLFCSVILVCSRPGWLRRAALQPVGRRPFRLRVKTEILFRPSTVAILGLCLSASAWFIPEFRGLKRGYEQPSVFTYQSVALLADWWLMIYLSLRAGEILGRDIDVPLLLASRVDRLEDKRIFVAFTAIAAVGIGLTYAKILKTLSVIGALAFIATGSGNELKEALYAQYSAGPLSLRYLVIFSASLAAYRFVYVKKWDILYALNAVLLLSSALLSSRLIFVATVVASAFLILRRSEKMRIRPLPILVGGLAVFVILATLNATRNANYYEKDDLYFWGGGASSILSYLAAPFQTAIGTANHILEISGTQEDTYRDYVDVEDTLNTNSSFVQNVESFGIAAWPLMAVMLFGTGFLFAFLQRYGRSMLLLACVALLYASSELWRLDLFRQGIFMVWLGAGLGVPMMLALVPRIQWFARRRVNTAPTPGG